MPEAQTAERDVSRSPPIARIAFDLRSSRCAASDPRQLRLGSAGHTLADLRKRVQNIVEVGGVEPAWGNLRQRRSEHISPGQGIFLGVPINARRVPRKPEKCVKRVSPCQNCVNKRA